MNCIDSVRDDNGKLFTCGHFDLVICDEAHRSIYNKYRDIFNYFDAPLVGLTATPKDEIEKNTYEIFDLENGVPTYGYELAQAVKDGYLVDFVTVESKTKFIEEGIAYDELSDENNPDFDIQLKYGLNGYAVNDRGSVIRLDIVCDTDFAGNVSVQTSYSEGFGTKNMTYARDVELKAGENTELEFCVDNMGSGIAKVEIKDSDGELVYSERDSLSIEGNDMVVAVGVMSDRQDAMSYIEDVSMDNVYDNAKVETVALSPSDIPESEEGLEAIEYLLVDDYDLSGLSEKQSAAIKQWVYSGGAMILAKSSDENELSSFDGDFVSAVNDTQKVHELDGFMEAQKIFQQGKVYYDALKAVHDVVKGGIKVKKSIELVAEISEIYVRNYQNMLADPNYTPDELTAISAGYAKLLSESADVLQDLKNVVNVTGMSLTDAERLAVINNAYKSLLNYRNLVNYYTRKNISVSYLRAKKKNDTDRVLALYGSADERYW